MKSPKYWAALLTTLLVIVIMSLQALSYLSGGSSGSSSSDDHSRQKRFLFFTTDRRLSFPPSTALLFLVFFNVPAIRNLPTGYTADLTLESTFSISVDDLGLTSEENPWFMIPYLQFTDDGNDVFPGISLAGGDRALMYQVVEDMMQNIGLLGKPCLLRAICEAFEVPFDNHGFIGELLKLFFSVSHAPYAERRLGDYLAAERSGKESGDCSYYRDACLHSLFTNTSVKEPKLIPVSEESRQKRFVYVTPERRLTLPLDSRLIFSPILSLPFRGSFPTGFSGPSVQVSGSIVVSFDDLGITSEENPFGVLPFLEDPEEEEEEDLRKKKRRRGRRETITRKSNPKYPGGDRDMFYQLVEDFLYNTGLNGKACLLRAICEMFQYPLDNHGFLGEILELFFSATLSPDADKRFPEYVAAERSGRTTGKCFMYHESCPFSFFSNPLDSNMTDDGEAKNDFSGKTRNPSAKNSFFSSSNMLAILFEYLESWL